MMRARWARTILTLTGATGLVFFRADAGIAATRRADVTIPMIDEFGHKLGLEGRICRPVGDGPARVVVINHGSPPHARARPRMELECCDTEASTFFTSRGYVVVYALRRGYGDSEGDWAEGYGRCADPDYVRGGLETALDIDAIVNYATALPYARHEGAIVIGQSAGGWGTMAYASVDHPRVAGLIVMAGGRGGHREGIAGSNCRPDALIAAAGHYGRSDATPMLWIYARNDSYFAPAIAEAMDRAFTQAGGRITFIQPDAYDDDGHKEFFGDGGSRNWGPPVLAYLRARDLAP